MWWGANPRWTQRARPFLYIRKDIYFMEKVNKMEMAVKMGYKYDPETGDIIGSSGKKLTWVNKKDPNSAYLRIHLQVSKKDEEGQVWRTRYMIAGHMFAWWWVYGEILEYPKFVIDHINGDKTDNSISNLRKVTQSQNQWNIHKDVKGYSQAGNKYVSRIRVNGKNIKLGRFDTEKEAKQAYLDAKEKYHIF
jgi:hypothetical protein